jgi:hypothetical protein
MGVMPGPNHGDSEAGLVSSIIPASEGCTPTSRDPGRYCHLILTGSGACGGTPGPVAPGSGSAALTVALCDRVLGAAAGARP